MAGARLHRGGGGGGGGRRARERAREDEVPRALNPPYMEKRWWLFILPQYVETLIQPTGIKKAIFLAKIRPCTNNIVYARFEDFSLSFYDRL